MCKWIFKKSVLLQTPIFPKEISDLKKLIEVSPNVSGFCDLIFSAGMNSIPIIFFLRNCPMNAIN